MRSVVKELGGVKATAEMFGRTENAVWNWIATDQFPANTYVAIRNWLKARRKSAPDALWSMVDAAPPAGRQSKREEAVGA